MSWWCVWCVCVSCRLTCLLGRSDSVVEQDGDALSVSVASLLRSEVLRFGVSLLAAADFKWQCTSNSSTDSGDALTRGQVAHGEEDLVDGAIDVGCGQDGCQILHLDLKLGNVGRNVELLQDVVRSVE